MAFEQVTGTSRGREQRQLRTCLVVCVPSGGSRWTTGRYKGHHDRPSPEQLQWTGCVGPSVSTLAESCARPTRPTPGISRRLLDSRQRPPPRCLCAGSSSLLATLERFEAHHLRTGFRLGGLGYERSAGSQFTV